MEHIDRIKEILDSPVVEDKKFNVKVSIDGLKTIITTTMDEGLRYRLIEEYLQFIISHIK